MSELLMLIIVVLLVWMCTVAIAYIFGRMRADKEALRILHQSQQMLEDAGQQLSEARKLHAETVVLLERGGDE